MKLLVVGDFHGKFPKKIKNIIKKEKIDVLVSNGDYFPFHFRKLWFKHCYGKDTGLWEIIGKKKYKNLIIEDLRNGENVLKKMSKLSIPVITVLGNVDFPLRNDVADEERLSGKKYWKWDWRRNFAFKNLIKKYRNIHLIDYSYTKSGDLIFIGARTGSYPGDAKSRAFKKHLKKLGKLFKKFRKENKAHKVIFVSHNIPYNTKLDIITSKEAHKIVIGKHYGSKLVRRIIDKYQPILAIGGHIHEGRGMQKLGKTLVVNPGAIHEGHYAIVEINEKTRKINVKLR